jgi:hypothetical protein
VDSGGKEEASSFNWFHNLKRLGRWAWCNGLRGKTPSGEKISEKAQEVWTLCIWDFLNVSNCGVHIKRG